MATPKQESTERDITLSDDLREVLVAIRHQLDKPPAARIERARLKRAEVTLDETFPDDLVAAWAVVDETGKSAAELPDAFSPEGAVAATAQIGAMGYEDADEGYVALCTTGAQEGEYACWANASSSPLKARRREDEGGSGTRVLNVEFSDEVPARPSRRSVGLVAWLRERHGVTDEVVAAVPESFTGAFRVMVLEPPAPKVRHAKFGEGSLIEDLGDRALIRFSDGKLRKLLKSSFEL